MSIKSMIQVNFPRTNDSHNHLHNSIVNLYKKTIANKSNQNDVKPYHEDVFQLYDVLNETHHEFAATHNLNLSKYEDRKKYFKLFIGNCSLIEDNNSSRIVLDENPSLVITAFVAHEQRQASFLALLNSVMSFVLFDME
jgi:hypothetical protein